MASEEQIAAANVLAAGTNYYVKRTTRKAVILHCSDPSIRLRVGEKLVWRQRRVVSRKSIVWTDHAKLRLTVAQLAARAPGAESGVAREA